MVAANLNLFFTVVAAVVTAFMGILVLFHDWKNVTNRIFFTHSLVGVIWSIINYVSLEVSPEKAIFWIRLVIAFAASHVLMFFIFVLNFPKENLAISKKKFGAILGIMVFMMLLALSPLAFSDVKVSSSGNISPVPGKLILIFALLMVFFFLFTITLVIRKYVSSENLLRRQWTSIGLGLITAYSLLIFLVFLRVIIWNDTTFVLYSPLFILPIFVGATLAILRHHLFNVKVIATEILTFLLLIASLVGVFIAETKLARTLAVGVTVFLLYFGILLIRSVLREVEQREQLQRLTEQLKSANERLKELDQLKSEFVSLATHQIRGPLTAIKGYASMIQQGDFGAAPEEIKTAVDYISQSSNHLVTIVEDFLDVSRIEQGKMKYDWSDFDMSELLKQVAGELKPVIEAKHLNLDLHLSAEPCKIHGDQGKLRQVIANLVDNAIKYTPEGTITVSVVKENETRKVRLSVKDTGVGMSETTLAHLFQKFSRASDASKFNIRGTGLGLYVARELLKAHSGRVWAESEGEGKGSTFSVELPAL